MKTSNNFQILLYLVLIAFAFEVVVLARQNKELKKYLSQQQAGQEKDEFEIKAGMKVPPMALSTLDNKPFELNYTERNKKTLIYFFSLTCPQCMRNIPQWTQLTASLKDENNVRILGIARGDVEAIKEYAKGYNLCFDVGVSAINDTTMANSYGVKYVPTTMLIDDSARVVYSSVGVLSESTRQEILNNIFSNTPVK